MNTFYDLAVMLYYEVLRIGSEYDRIDIVFDRYFDSSLKEDARSSHGNGALLTFDENTDIPQDMPDNFLKNSENKNNLGEFLDKKMIDMHQNPKHLVATYKTSVLCSSEVEAADLHDVLITSCQSEEADQRLIRYTLHCVSEKYGKIAVRTVNTDVLVLFLSYVSQVHDSSSNIVIYAHMLQPRIL